MLALCLAIKLWRLLAAVAATLYYRQISCRAGTHAPLRAVRVHLGDRRVHAIGIPRVFVPCERACRRLQIIMGVHKDAALGYRKLL